MCASIYLSALSAAVRMGEAIGVQTCRHAKLLGARRARMEAELFNGEYFAQKIQRTRLNVRVPEDTEEGGFWPPPEAGYWK